MAMYHVGRSENSGRNYLFLEKLKDAAFIVLKDLNRKKVGFSNTLSYIYCVVEYLQILSFMFPIPGNTILYDKFSLGVILDWFAYFCAIFQVTPYIQYSGKLVFILGIIAIVIVFMYMLLVYFSYKDLVNDRLFQVPVYFLNLISRTLLGILLVPILNLLFLQISSCEADSIVGCWSSSHVIVVVISYLSAFLYIFCVFLYNLIVFSRDPASSFIQSSPNARLECLFVFFKVSLCLFFSSLSKLTFGVYFLAILILLQNLVLFYSFVTLLPYFCWHFNILRSICNALLLWTSFTIVVNVFTENDIDVIFYLLIPFVCGFGYSLCKLRRNEILDLKNSDLRSPAEVELKARFILEPVTRYLIVKRSDHGILGSEIDGVSIGYSYEALLSVHQTAEEMDREHGIHSSLIDEADRIYCFGLRHFPVSAMYILRAQFCFKYRNDRAISHRALNKAEREEPFFDTIFTINIIREIFEKSDLLNMKDIFCFLSYDKVKEECLAADERVTLLQAEFWKELLSNVPRIQRLHVISGKIGSSINLAHSLFMKLIAINPSSTEALRLFSSFIIEVQNQPDKSKPLLQRVTEIEQSRATGILFSILYEILKDFLSLTNDRNAVVSCLGSLESMGEITNTSVGMLKLLGHKKIDLIGKKVHELVPEPFCRKHESSMYRYYETGITSVINANHNVFALHKSGFIVPVSILVKEVTSFGIYHSTKLANRNESLFVAVFKKWSGSDEFENHHGPYDKESVAFCFISESLKLMECCSTFANLFGFSSDLVRSGSLNVVDFIDGFEDVVSSLTIKRVHKNLLLKLPQIQLKCFSSLQVLKIGEVSCYLVSLQLSSELFAQCFNVKRNFDLGDSAHLETSPSLAKLPKQDFRKADVNQNLFGTRLNSKSLSKVSPADVFSESGDQTLDSYIENQTAVNDPLSEDDISLVNSDDLQHTAGDIELENNQLNTEAPVISTNFNYSDELFSKVDLHERLRLFSRLSESQGLTLGLRRLRFILFISIILLFLIAIVKFVMMGELIYTYTESLYDVYSSARLRYLVVKMVFSVHVLTFAPVYLPTINFPGFIPTSECRDFYQGIIMPEIADEIDSLVDFIFLERSKYLSKGHEEFYLLPNVVIQSQQNVNSMLSLQISKVTLFDALKLFVMKARITMKMDLFLTMDYTEEPFYILQNGLGDILKILNDSTFLYDSDTKDSVRTIYAWAISLTLGAIFSIIIVILFVIKPAVWIVEDNKEAVLILFTEIPTSVVRSFLSKCNLRLEKFKCLDDSASESKNSDFNEEIYPMESNYSSKTETVSNEISESESFKLANRHWIILKIGFISLISFVYFIVTYWFEYGAISSILYNNPSAVNWSQYRTVEFLLSMLYMRKLLLQNYTREFLGGSSYTVQVSPSYVFSHIQFLSEIENGLAYGSTCFKLLPPSSNQRNILFTSASCTRTNNYIPAVGCSEFMDGFLNHGLHRALLQSVEIMKSAYVSIVAQLAVNVSDFDGLNSTFNNANNLALRSLQEYYLPPIETYSSYLYINEAQSMLNDVYIARLVSLILFILFIFTLLYFYLNPLVWDLNSDHKRTITLLMMIPSNIMQKMFSLRAFVEKLALELETE